MDVSTASQDFSTRFRKTPEHRPLDARPCDCPGDPGQSAVCCLFMEPGASNTPATVPVNCWRRTITFEGAYQKAVWRTNGAIPRSGCTVQDTQEIKMKFALIGAAAVAAASFATPALAQQVIENPGYCAQYYPNANCQNLGPGNPYTSNGYRYEYGNYAGDSWQNGNAYMEPQPRLHRHHRKHHS
jgi:hypothetical protein